MKRHNYLSKIDNDTWTNIQNLKTQLHEPVSVNYLINRGLRTVIKEELQNLSTYRKNRESLNSMMSV